MTAEELDAKYMAAILTLQQEAADLESDMERNADDAHIITWSHYHGKRSGLRRAVELLIDAHNSYAMETAFED